MLSKTCATQEPWKSLCHVSLLLALAAALSGCGKKAGPAPPPTFSVTGEVHHADGEPVAKGLVQFFPENGPSRNISAPIKDGKFTLVTAFANDALQGVPEGRYHVTVVPSFFQGAPVTVKLPDIYEIKPQENHFKLTLPKGTPK
jgi:hypothetical protein